LSVETQNLYVRRPISLGDVLVFAMTANESTRKVTEAAIAQAALTAPNVLTRPESGLRARLGRSGRRALWGSKQGLVELRAGADLELAIGAAQVHLDRLHRDEERLRDLLVGRRGGGAPPQEIVVAGSIRLVRTLLENDLADELRLMIYPVVLGAGERLFGETSDQRPVRLVETRTVDDLAYLTYEVVRDA
jgi:RibD C-terminal domain